MLETLISSKTRIKLLLKFFLNSKATSYLRGLETEFGDSTNSIRIELNRFEKAGMLTSYLQGNKKYFKANTEHPLYHETHKLLIKYIGFDTIIDRVIGKLGDIKRVYVVGAFANGLDDKNIELVFVGELNQDYLKDLIEKVESNITRRIKYEVISGSEFSKDHWDKEYSNSLLLWEA